MGQLFVGGEPPILACCKVGDLAGLKALDTNENALHNSKHLNTSELIIGKGDVNGWTCLQVACAHGHVDIVQYLVETRSVPILIDSPDSPLQLARSNGNDEVMKYLCSQVRSTLCSLLTTWQVNRASLGDLLENMNDPVILVKGSSTIVGFNKSAESLLGFQKHEVCVKCTEPLTDR